MSCSPARLKNLEAKFPAFMDKYLSEIFRVWGDRMDQPTINNQQ